MKTALVGKVVAWEDRRNQEKAVPTGERDAVAPRTPALVASAVAFAPLVWTCLRCGSPGGGENLVEVKKKAAPTGESEAEAARTSAFVASAVVVFPPLAQTHVEAPSVAGGETCTADASASSPGVRMLLLPWRLQQVRAPGPQVATAEQALGSDFRCQAASSTGRREGRCRRDNGHMQQQRFHMRRIHTQLVPAPTQQQLVVAACRTPTHPTRLAAWTYSARSDNTRLLRRHIRTGLSSGSAFHQL